VSPGRLETFADGVFAIAATLLILTVDGAVHGHGADLGESLRHAWPAYVGYVVSFVTIGIMWMNHHTVMSLIAHVDRRFLLSNLGLLMCIAFVPFPTRLVAENIRGDGAESAALAYGFTMTATAVFFNLVWFYAERGRRLLRADADSTQAHGAVAPRCRAATPPGVDESAGAALGLALPRRAQAPARREPEHHL
jgi:uncharacterized membrane protein